MTTLKDVAKEAGVSVTTVSYVLHKGQYVSPQMHDKVMAAVNKLGYVGNMSARSLRRGRTGIIEIAVHELDMPYFYSKFAQIMAAAVERHGFEPLIIPTNLKRDRVERELERIAKQMCDGLVMYSEQLPGERMRALAMANRPVVLFDDHTASGMFDTVLAPNEMEGRAAAEHLIDMGCRHIGVVGFSAPGKADDAAGADVRRLRGIRAAMLEHGLSMTERDYGAAGWTVESGHAAAQSVIALALPFDGVICVNDGVAFGLIRGLADRGITVPDSMKVIGFDGISLGAYCVPRISTVALDLEDVAEKTVSMLVSRIEGTYEGAARRETAGYRLIARESTLGR